MTDDIQLKSNLAFYKFGGTIGRLDFFINSLILAAVFGASFCFLLFAGKETAAGPYSLWQLVLYTVFLGGICGVLLIIFSGLTCLYMALFYTSLFTFGSLVSSATSNLQNTIFGLLTGLVMTWAVILAYGNIAKRIRDILGTDKRTHLWCVGTWLLSAILLIGTILYFVLLTSPRFLNVPKKIPRWIPIASVVLTVAFIILIGPQILMGLLRFNGVWVHKDLASALKSPKRTQHLSLPLKKYTSIPSEVFSLENLRSFNLSGNELKTLPPEISKWKKMEDFYLMDNQLESLPKGLFDLIELKKLDLNKNHLMVLPSEVGHLKKLQYLFLNDNNLASLPPEIGELRELKTLWLENNKLTLIPAEIGNLSALQALNISGNSISHIPAEIQNLSNLGYFCFTGNPIPEEEKRWLREKMPKAKCPFERTT